MSRYLAWSINGRGDVIPTDSKELQPSRNTPDKSGKDDGSPYYNLVSLLGGKTRAYVRGDTYQDSPSRWLWCDQWVGNDEGKGVSKDCFNRWCQCLAIRKDFQYGMWYPWHLTGNPLSPLGKPHTPGEGWHLSCFTRFHEGVMRESDFHKAELQQRWCEYEIFLGSKISISYFFRSTLLFWELSLFCLLTFCWINRCFFFFLKKKNNR